jgi:hypothetical protein
MNLLVRHPLRLSLAGLVLAAVASPLPGVEPATPPATVAELYAGETADTGPQYLLRPVAPKEKRWMAWTRADFSWTDNATFSATNPRASNIASWQGGLDVRLLSREAAGGRLTVAAGGRGQIFRYGFLGGSNKVIDFLQVDRNNFDLLGTGARATWQREGWLATSAVQASLLRNRSAGRTFYRELAWDAGLYRQWRTAGGSTLLAGGEVIRHWTWTDTYGLLPSGWNDRLEAALSAVWSQPVRTGLIWRSTLRLQGADYTHAGRHRRDGTGIAGTELAWSLREHLELRLYLAHERRNSNEAGVADYQRWEAGSGAAVQWEF